jgi:DNA-binding transcriptional regulator YdaS (Cro superfamily)
MTTLYFTLAQCVNSRIDVRLKIVYLTEMKDAPRDNIYGYQQVLKAIKAQIGPSSPQAWLSEQLGVSRQVIYQWANRDGIPRAHVPTIARLTGMAPVEIRPEDVVTSIPGSIFDEIAKQATAKKTTFAARLVAIIKAGLHLNP